MNNSQLILSDKYTLRKTSVLIEKALKNNPKLKTAIFLDNNKKLKGIITLGDIRRYINNFDPNTNISKLINKNPITCKQLELDNNLNNLIKDQLQLKKLKNIDDIIIINEKKKFLRTLEYQEILNNSHYKNICIVGLGHIGLTLSIHLLKYFSNIDGVDISKKKIENIKKNRLVFYERNLEGFLKNALKKNNLRLHNHLSATKSQIYIVCVGTDISKKNKPNNNNLFKIFRDLSKKIKKGDILIARGTLQLGVSNFLVKLIEKVSKLKCGDDFYFSYMPERIIEGNALDELEKIPQIISGHSVNCLKKINEFSSKCFKNIVNVSSLEEAEIIKLASNSFRDMNFAFSNEIARIANNFKLSGHDLIKKANFGYDRNTIKLPSIGVGGFCLPKDPYLFSEFYNSNISGYKLAKNSRQINDMSYEILFKKINKFRSETKTNKLKILILGIAFKGFPETIDIRNSPSIFVFNQLKRKHNVKLYDNLGIKILKNNLNLKKNISLKIKKIDEFDLVICMNNHKSYGELIEKNISINSTKKQKMLIDVWELVDKNFIESYKWLYQKI